MDEQYRAALKKSLAPVLLAGTEAAATAAGLGPVWPILMPLVETIRNLKAPADMRMETLLDEWEATANQAAQRLAIAEAVYDTLRGDNAQTLTMLAKVKDMTILDSAARAQQFRAQFLTSALVGFHLHRALRTTDSEELQTSIRDITVRMSILGATAPLLEHITSAVAAAKGTQSNAEATQAAYHTVRDFISCRAHPFSLVPFHLGAAASAAQHSDEELETWLKAVDDLWTTLQLPTSLLPRARECAARIADVLRFSAALAQYL